MPVLSHAIAKKIKGIGKATAKERKMLRSMLKSRDGAYLTRPEIFGMRPTPRQLGELAKVLEQLLHPVWSILKQLTDGPPPARFNSLTELIEKTRFMPAPFMPELLTVHLKEFEKFELKFGLCNGALRKDYERAKKYMTVFYKQGFTILEKIVEILERLH